jgi:hypothetical protein
MGAWYAVLSYNPAALYQEADPGFIWVQIENRIRKLPADYFEFSEA